MNVEQMTIEYQRALNIIDFIESEFKKNNIELVKYERQINEKKKIRRRKNLKMLLALNKSALNKKIKEDQTHCE